MKILYHIPNPRGIGADRWIYTGWKNAFTNLGHHVFELTAFDTLEEKGRAVAPDVFMTAVNLIDFTKDVPMLKEMRKNGTRVALWIHWPLVRDAVKATEAAESCLLGENIADVYFGEREPEGMGDFEERTSKKYHVIPHGADRLFHFPVVPVSKYSYDIVYLGARLGHKRWFFDNVLRPLRRRHRVGIFGPYWTLKDNLLRAGQKACMKMKFRKGAELLNDLRITIPPDEENALYSSAKICLNFHEREPDGSQPHYIVNQRTFKICACGGFQICDHVPAIRKYFAEDELVMARIDKDDWLDKIDYYITHDKEREEIRRRGTDKALRDHTYHNRVKQLIDLLGSL